MPISVPHVQGFGYAHHWLCLVIGAALSGREQTTDTACRSSRFVTCQVQSQVWGLTMRQPCLPLYRVLGLALVWNQPRPWALSWVTK